MKWWLIGGGVVLAIGILIYMFSQEKSTHIMQEIPEEKLPWEEKKMPTEVLKIGLITDTQIHPSRIDKSNKSPEAERFLKERYAAPLEAFTQQMQEFIPDFLAITGDIIEGTNDEDYVGMAGLKLVKEMLDTVSVPVFYVLGNHDLRSVNREQFKEVLGLENIESTSEMKGYKIILIDSNFYPDDTPVTIGGKRHIRGHVSAEGLNFLERELQTDLPTLVFLHHPPLIPEDDVFGDKKTKQFLDNGKDVQEILERYNATAVFAGHLETKFSMEKNGVQYFSFPGPKKSPDYIGAFYEIRMLPGGEAAITMFYKDPETDEYISVDFRAEEYKN